VSDALLYLLSGLVVGWSLNDLARTLVKCARAPDTGGETP
jgi:hypothetical protein